MKETLEKYQVFVVLILIIMIMAVAKIKYGNNGKTIKNYPPRGLPNGRELKITNEQIRPTATPTVVKDYPLQSHLPYQGNGFIIEKYIAPMTLNLKLTTATQQQAAKDITVWLESFGEAGSDHILEIEEVTPTGKLKIKN